MTTAASPRHPFELLLEQLTGCMSKPKAPLRHGFGMQEESAHTSADRIVWIPGKIGVEDLPYQLPNVDSPKRQACLFYVSIYAGSPIGAYSKHAELVGYLDLLVGPPQGAPPSHDGTRPHRPGYRVLDTDDPAPRGGDGASLGYGLIVPVVLFNPITSVELVPRAIASTSFDVQTTDLDGTGAETAVANP